MPMMMFRMKCAHHRAQHNVQADGERVARALAALLFDVALTSTGQDYSNKLLS